LRALHSDFHRKVKKIFEGTDKIYKSFVKRLKKDHKKQMPGMKKWNHVDTVDIKIVRRY
jgi:hypothetical protein